MSKYRSFVSLVIAFFLTVASAAVFSASKVEALGLARLEIERLRIEKLGAIDQLRADLRAGKIDRAEFRKGVNAVKKSFSETINTAKVAFRTLKIQLRGTVDDATIDKAEKAFDAAVEKAIADLNSFLIALAKDLGIPPGDLPVTSPA